MCYSPSPPLTVMSDNEKEIEEQSSEPTSQPMKNGASAKVEGDYDASSIQVLEACLIPNVPAVLTSTFPSAIDAATTAISLSYLSGIEPGLRRGPAVHPSRSISV